MSKIALLGPAVPMPVSDGLLAAAKADDHVAFELINGWSHSAGKQLGGNQVPGMWMTGAAMRLMERSRPGRAARGPRRVPLLRRRTCTRPRRCAARRS